jgi:chromosome partitioning protein
MPKVICVANMKGGVGKTTLCVNLAFTLFLKGLKAVLIVDNDPQFNATTALMTPAAYIESCIKTDSHPTIYNIYERPPRVGRKTVKPLEPSKFFIPRWSMRNNPDACLDLIASRLEVYETLRNPSQKEYLLDKFLKRHATKYDYILIDCPPTPSVLTLSAFAASDYVLIPVAPDYFSSFGLPQFLGTLKDFKAELVDSHNIRILGVVFTNVPRQPSVDTQKAIDRVTETLRDSEESVHIFDSRVSHLRVFEKALWQSNPVARVSGPGTRGKSEAKRELWSLAGELETKTV